MPKRPKTPPPSDDELKYLSVVHPFPLHGNWELPGDRLEFMCWIASITGLRPFLSMYHKPRSANMVIIEISRDFDGFDKLLGEHRWSEMLVKPSEEEKLRVSKIYYCTYRSGREVQKYGWKQIYLEEDWFKNWSPVNQMIKFPYPITHWCDLPTTEDRTNNSLCRPLPTQQFPAPIIEPAPRIVPGAPGWETQKAIKEEMKKRQAQARRENGPAPRANIMSKNSSKTTGPTIFNSWTGPTGSNVSAIEPNDWVTAPSKADSVTHTENISAWADNVSAQVQPPGLQADTVSSSASGSSSGPATPTRENHTPPATRRWADYEDDEDLDPLDMPTAGSVHIEGGIVEAYEELERMTMEDVGDFVSAPIPENNDWELDSWAGDGGVGADGWKNENPRYGALSANDGYDAQSAWGGTGANKGGASAAGGQEKVKTKDDFVKEITCDTHGILCKKKLCLDHSEQVKQAWKAYQAALNGKQKQPHRGPRGGAANDNSTASTNRGGKKPSAGGNNTGWGSKSGSAWTAGPPPSSQNKPKAAPPSAAKTEPPKQQRPANSPSVPSAASPNADNDGFSAVGKGKSKGRQRRVSNASRATSTSGWGTIDSGGW